jgi:hypothetical protein
VKLLLKLFIALGVLIILLVIVVAVSPQGRALFGMARSLVAAGSSPAAQELMKHGCATAFVAPLGELVGTMGKIVDLEGDETMARIVEENPVLILCVAEATAQAPACNALAVAYGSFEPTAPAQFGVIVQHGETESCSGYYDKQGNRVGELDADGKS